MTSANISKKTDVFLEGSSGIIQTLRSNNTTSAKKALSHDIVRA